MARQREKTWRLLQAHAPPTLDDEGPPLDYGDGVLDVGALEAIQPDLDSLIDFALSTDPPTDFGTYLYP